MLAESMFIFFKELLLFCTFPYLEMKSPEFEVTPTGETQPEVKALLVSGALYIVIMIFWLPGHQVNITLKKLSGDPILLLLLIFLYILFKN